MTGNLFRMLFIVVMIAVIVSVDLLFLRHHFMARLIVNIGIAVAFVIVYFFFSRKRSAAGCASSKWRVAFQHTFCTRSHWHFIFLSGILPLR